MATVRATSRRQATTVIGNDRDWPAAGARAHNFSSRNNNQYSAFCHENRRRYGPRRGVMSGTNTTSGSSVAAVTAHTGPSFKDQVGECIDIPMATAVPHYDTSSDQSLTTPPRPKVAPRNAGSRQVTESASPRGLPEHLARGVRPVTQRTREARDPPGIDDVEQSLRQLCVSDNGPDDTPSHISRTERAAAPSPRRNPTRGETVPAVQFSRQSESTDRLEPTAREVMARILLITIDGLDSPSKTVIKKIAVNRLIELHPLQFEVGCNEVVLRDRLQEHWDQVAVHECKPVYDDTLEMLIELGYVVTSTRQSPGGNRRYANSWTVHYLSGKGLKALVDERSAILPSASSTNVRASGYATPRR